MPRPQHYAWDQRGLMIPLSECRHATLQLIYDQWRSYSNALRRTSTPNVQVLVQDVLYSIPSFCQLRRSSDE